MMGLFDQTAVFQQDLHIGSLDLLEQDFQGFFFCKGKFYICDRFLVDCIVACTQEFAHVILTSPYFRNTAVNIK